MKLSNNFSLEELTDSKTANKLGIDNTPNKEELENLSILARTLLQPIRDAWNAPIVVSSGFRCYALNKAVGGTNGSQHRCATAADIHTKENTKKKNKELFNMIAQLAKDGKIHYRQLIDEKNYTWIHIAINDKQHTYKDREILHL